MKTQVLITVRFRNKTKTVMVTTIDNMVPLSFIEGIAKELGAGDYSTISWS